MRTTYRPIAVILCRHGYFADGICRALSIRPTAACSDLMQHYKYRFRPATGGGTIYVTADGAGSPPPAMAPTTPLGFTLTFDDPRFVTYTDAGWIPSRIVNYSNRASDGTMSTVSGGGLSGQSLPLKGRPFSHHLEGPRPPGALTLTPFGAPSVPLPAVPGPVDRLDLDLDLGPFPDGRYHLSAGLAPILDFYLSDAPAPGLWGTIDLYGLGNQAPDTATPPLYTIDFIPRATVWRYVLLGAAVGTGAHLSFAGRMNDRKTLIPFNKPSPVRFGDGTALAFETTNPLAASERPGDLYAITLTIEDRGSAGDLVRPMPGPGPEAQILKGIDGDPDISEIIINL